MSNHESHAPALRQHLVAHVEAWSQLAKGQGLANALVGAFGGPATLEQFILRNANVSGRGEHELPYCMRRGRKKKECFKNAYNEADPGGIFTYCEGFAMNTTLSPFPFLHAWIVNMRGLIFDPTLKNAHNYEYLGITVPYHQLRVETLRTGVYGLLDPGTGLNTDFMDRYEKS